METSREDVGIQIRSAFLVKGTKQKFSLFALIILSIILIFAETIQVKPLNYLDLSLRMQSIVDLWLFQYHQEILVILRIMLRST